MSKTWPLKNKKVMFFLHLHSSENQTLRWFRGTKRHLKCTVVGTTWSFGKLFGFKERNRSMSHSGRKRLQIILSSTTVSTTLVRPNFFRKKVSGTPLKLDHGLLTYELPEVLGENLALCSMILLLKSNTIKSIAPQQQIQMQTILTPNIFEVNTINTTIPLL